MPLVEQGFDGGPMRRRCYLPAALLVLGLLAPLQAVDVPGDMRQEGWGSHLSYDRGLVCYPQDVHGGQYMHEAPGPVVQRAIRGPQGVVQRVHVAPHVLV
jgi:hypothetical protein